TGSGNVQNDMEYTTIDFNLKIDDSVFELDLPDDVEIESIDDEYSEEEITFKEIPDKLKQPALYFPGSDEHQLNKISSSEFEGEQLVTIDYKQNELPLLTLMIHTENEVEDDEAFDLLDEGFEKETIRKEEGLYMDFNDFKSMSWSEGGLSY